MNLKLFKKRLRCLYANWSKHKQDLWGNTDVLLVSTPPTISPDSISNRFYQWLLGYDFADTIAIFTSKEIHFICNKQKASLLKPLLSSAAVEAVDAQVILHEKAKGDDGFEIMDKVLSDLRVQYRLRYLSFLVSISKSKYECDAENDNNSSQLIVGYVVGESPASKILWGLSTKKTRGEFQTVDIKDGLGKFALLSKVEDNQKERVEEKRGESVVWWFKRDQDEREVDIYLQALSKEEEEKIHLAEVKKPDENLQRRGKKVEAIKSDEMRDVDGLDEWVLI